MKKSWHKVDTQQLLKHPRLTIVEDNVVLPSGHTTKYLRFEDIRDYVTVVAEDNGKLALIKEYAYPTDQWLWQLPEGTIDAGETIEGAGLRELREETGLVAEEIKKISTSLGYHRRSTQQCHVMYATRISSGDKLPGDIEEQGTELFWVPVSEVRNMIRDGLIIQQSALSALAVYFSGIGSKLSTEQ